MMQVDSIDVRNTRVKAARAELYAKGTVGNGGRSWELRASGVRGLPPLGHAWPVVTVRCAGDIYTGRVFVDSSTDSPRLFGLLGQA